jgi:hypothetical protein
MLAYKTIRAHKRDELAQQAGRTYRLGCLQPVPRDTPPILALLDDIRTYGFIEGKNLTIGFERDRYRSQDIAVIVNESDCRHGGLST